MFPMTRVVRAVRDDGEAAAHVVFPVRRFLGTRHHSRKAFGHGFDRGEGIVELMANDADQTLPCEALLLAKSLAQIGDEHELVRLASLAKAASMDFPAAHFPGEGD